MVSAAPKPTSAVQRRDALVISLQPQACLRKYVCAPQMVASEALFSTVVVGGFEVAKSQMAEGKKVSSVGAPRVLSMQTAGCKQRILGEIIVEVVED